MEDTYFDYNLFNEGRILFGSISRIEWIEWGRLPR